MDQIQLSRFHERLMDLLTMDSCSITPTRDRAFIQAKGLHNGLYRTPIGEQGYHDHDELDRLPQTLKHGSSSGTKRLFTDLAPIALPLTVMDRNGTLSDFSRYAEHASFGQNCFDVSIGSVFVFIYHSMPGDTCFFKSS